ncbi:hypothetical protein [Actinotalea subterranea]|uniref:hypothetical protein n=1 Tax=Actinotalea subterranea TaxID=2607497 RepID=UPI00165DC8F1|nr:hypothetical protein [Actinotalea subterranea]
MSYDLAVWAGTAPASARAATDEYERRMDALEASLDQAGGPPSATPAIRAFVEAALARYPDLDDDAGDECPWASSPLIGEAAGDFIYFPMTFSGATYARDVLAAIARDQGLVCYDPQIERLLPASDATSASEIGARAAAAMKAHGEEHLVRPSQGGWLRRLFHRG